MIERGMRPDNHLFAGLVTLYADTGHVGLAGQWLQAKVRASAARRRRAPVGGR